MDAHFATPCLLPISCTIVSESPKIFGALIQVVTYKKFIPAMGIELNPYTGYKEDIQPGYNERFPERLTAFVTQWHQQIISSLCKQKTIPARGKL